MFISSLYNPINKFLYYVIAGSALSFKFLLLSFLFISGLPVVFTFVFWLKRKIWNPKKDGKKSFLFLYNPTNYLKLKSTFNAPDIFTCPLKKDIQLYISSNIPGDKFPLNRVANGFLYHIYTSLLALNDLNQEQFRSHPVFKFVPQDKLWQNTNHACDHWM